MNNRSIQNLAFNQQSSANSHLISPLLEQLSRTRAITPLCIFIPAILVLSWLAFTRLTFPHFAAFFALGLFLWTLIEYVMHRFLYHYQASNKFLKIFLLLTHGLHHDDPQDKGRLVSITLVSLIDTLLVTGIYYLVFGKEHCLAVIAGTLMGYIIYDLIHYDVHVSNRKNRLFQYLKRYHFAHHYVDNDRAFGVSSPLWDYVFGTRVVYLSAKKPRA